MKLLQIIGNLLGIGKDALNSRAELKKLKAKQEHSIIEAQTKAQVDGTSGCLLQLLLMYLAFGVLHEKFYQNTLSKNYYL